MRYAVLSLLALALAGCFPHAPGRRLAHFDQQAPRVGSPAPTFVLQGVDGEPVELAELIGERPIVIQLGSHSCPVYRYRRFSMERLIRDYQDRVHFLVVYTIEAHPTGSKSPYDDEEWVTMINRVTGVRIPEPADEAERLERAAFSRDRLELSQTVLVDGLDNEVWSAYGGASSPGFVVDLEGRVALRQVWIDPSGIRKTLDRLLEGVPAGP